MKKTKVMAAAAAFAVLTMMMSGCGGKSSLDPDNPVTIEVQTYYNGAHKIAFDELVTEFNNTVGSEKGIFVKHISSGDLNELLENLEFELSKPEDERELSDLFSCYASTALKFEEQGLLVDLDDWFSEEELSEYLDAYIEEGRMGSDQALTLFPTAKSTEVLTVNMTDWEPFANDTGAVLEDLSSWEGVAETAEKYYDWTDAKTDAPDDGKALFGMDAFANFVLTGLHQLGADPFQVKDGTVELNMDKEAMRKIWDVYYVPYISGYYAEYGRFRSDDMKTGDLIASVGSSSGASYMPTEVTVGDAEPYPIETEELEVPNFEGADPVAVQQGAGMVVSKSDAVREEATVIFLKWFTDSYVNTQFCIQSSYLPVKKEANQLSFIEDVVENEKLEWNEEIRRTMEVSFEESTHYELYTMPVFEGSDACRTVIGNSLREKAAGDREQVKIRLEEGTQSLEEIVNEFNTDEQFDNWCEEFTQQLKENL